MGTFSDSLIAVADRLLDKYGEAATISRNVYSGYNPATSETAISSTTAYTADVHARPYVQAEIDGENILSSDLRAYVASTTSPEIDDVFTVNSIEYRAQTVDLLRAQGVNVVYIVQLRI